MPTRPIELPLVGGVREDIARELLPDGLLRSVHNYRVAKPGSIVRRRGYSNPNGTPIYDSPAGTDNNYVVRLIERNGQTLAWGQENVLGSQYPGDSSLYIKEEGTRYWHHTYFPDNTLSPPSPCSAVQQVIRERTMEDARFCSVATVSGYTLVAWMSGTSLCAALYDSDGGRILYETIDDPVNECTTIACGENLYVVWRDGTAINYRTYETAGIVTNPATTQYTNSADSTDPAWDVAVDGFNPEEIVVAFNHTDTTVHVDVLDATVTPWDPVAGQTDTYATIGDRGLAIARYGLTATILLVGDTSGTGTLSAVMWDGGTSVSHQQAAVAIETAFDWTLGPFTVNCDATGYWAAWSFEARPTGYAAACDVQMTKHCTLDPTIPNKGATKNHYRAKVGGKARDGYCWLQYGRDASLERQYMLVTGFGASAENLVARTSYRIAGETLGVADSHPLSRPCPDGNGNYIWAARELFDGELSRAAGTENRVGLVVHKYSLTSATRAHHVELGALHFAGGAHRTWDGAHVVDPPFCSPDPMDATSWLSDTGAGSLTGDYNWKVVYATFDAAGNVWRSAPSTTLSATGLSSDQITIRVEGVGYPGVWAEVYRQHTDNTWRYVGSTLMTPNSESVDIVDTGASIATRELLYTTGGEPESYPTPSSDIMVEWNRRLFVASGDQLYYSHSYDFADGRNLAPWMVETFYVQFQEVITGLAPLDSALLVFTASSIYLLTGDGPNRLGQGFYSNPQTISSDVGCVDWRSVAVFRDGVAFRSERGFELIPKGSYSVVPFGDPIEDTVASYTMTTSAVVQPELDQVRWTLRSATSGIVVAYDYIAKEWATETAPAYDGALILDDEYTVWSGTAAVSNASGGGGAYQQADQYVDDDGDGTTTAYTSYLETGDIRSSGKLGWQSVQEVDLLGTLRANATIEIGVAIDGEDEFDDRESVAHYVPTDLTSGASLTGVTFVAATGVLTENSSLSVHQLYQSLAYQTTDLVYMRGVISGLGRGVAFGPLSQSRILLATDGTWSIVVTAGSVEGGEVQDLGGGRYLLEMLAYPTVSPRSWGIGGQSSGSLSYTGDGRDICTIESLEIGYASWTHGALRQSFSPMRGSCEALRIRVKDASTTQGAELAALRLDIKPKRGAGRLPKYIRS